MWVLLIEDDAGAAKSIELMLKAKDHTCDIKRLGEDGLEAAGLYSYDVILLDLMLPDMDGLEVLRRLRANQINAPVLILSGLSDVGHKAKGLNSGDLTVNFDTQSVEIAGNRVYVTPKEYLILELLCQRQGVVLSKEVFLDHLYAGRDEPETKIIDVFVCKLRKKLTEASGGKNYIETVWGRGYMLRAPTDSIEGSIGSSPAAPQRAAV